MWVERDIWHDARHLQQATEFFETHIYPRTRLAFGSEWTPGIDNDPHIHILHATGLGENVLGYNSTVDECPRSACALSNEAEMITVNLDRIQTGSPSYNAVLARQFQMLVPWHQDRNEERWVREGLAALAALLNGFDDADARDAYVWQPDKSLVSCDGSESQRGAASLFFTYFHQRFGDAGTRILTAESANGIAGI
jgi:hypothetical protein